MWSVRNALYCWCTLTELLQWDVPRVIPWQKLEHKMLALRSLYSKAVPCHLKILCTRDFSLQMQHHSPCSCGYSSINTFSARMSLLVAGILTMYWASHSYTLTYPLTLSVFASRSFGHLWNVLVIWTGTCNRIVCFNCKSKLDKSSALWALRMRKLLMRNASLGGGKPLETFFSFYA